MHDDLCEWYAECQKIRQENAILLNEFCTWLTDSGLSATTIKRHRINLDFHVNHFLLYGDSLSPADDIQSVEEF